MKIFLCLSAQFLVMSLGIVLFQYPSYAEFLDASVEFSVPFNATMGSDSLFTPFANYKGNSFFVWLDAGFRPQVTQKTATGILTAPLDANPDYTCFHEGHHRFSLGIDKNGYIHVTGDMHYYPSGPNSNLHMPVRYRNQVIMYWVSNNPYDVSGGFTFAGGLNNPRAIYASGMSYGRFFHSRTGELYWTALTKAFADDFAFLQGMMGVALYKYDSDKQTWTALGGFGTPKTPPQTGVPAYKVIFWEDAGIDGWFQGYQSMFQFDNANRLHFVTAAVVDPTMRGNTRILYAMSPDGGLTWKRADGSQIPGLPLRGADSSPNVADVVLDTKGVSYLSDYAAVAPDANGTPSVFVDVWRRWDGQKWNSDISDGIHASGDHGYLGIDGRLTFLESNTIWLKRMQEFQQNSSPFLLQRYLPDNGLHFFTWVSDLGLYTTGSLYGVGVNDSNLNNFQVTKVTFTSGPLPSGWADQDVGNKTNRGGSSDYVNGTYSLRASGMGVNGVSDELHYTYRSLYGDGTIIARIANQHIVTPWYFDATEGVMMRETLDEGSKFAAMGVSYKNGARWMFRTDTGGTAQDNMSSGSDPLWVKLVRSGDQFTAFRSAEGTTWSPVGSPQTISMGKAIYVGLMADAYSSYDVHEATVDNVTVDGLLPPSQNCVRAIPIVSLTPSNQTISVGQAVDFVVTTTNPDSIACGGSKFLLYTNIIPDHSNSPTGIDAQLLPSEVMIEPGQSVTSQLHLSSGLSTPVDSYTAWVSSRNTASTQEVITSATLIVTALPQVCVRANPTTTLTPSNQTVLAGNSVDYEVATTNKDSGACGASNFLFYTNIIPDHSSGPSGIDAHLLPSSIVIAPGQTVTSQLHLSVSLSTLKDSYAVWVSAENTASTQEALISGSLTVITSTSSSN